MNKALTIVIALGLVAGAATVAEAQPGGDPGTGLAPRLREVRGDHLAQRETAGWLLLSWGALNVAAGATVAAAGHDDTRLLAGGVTAASWGLVNGLLSLFLFDLSGERARAIVEGTHGDLDDPDRVREQAVVDQLRSGQVFALNLGLDVFYIAGGVLAYLLGRAEGEDALAAAGLVSAGQGAFLFAFDLYEWLAANSRADRLRAL